MSTTKIDRSTHRYWKLTAEIMFAVCIVITMLFKIDYLFVHAFANCFPRVVICR